MYSLEKNIKSKQHVSAIRGHHQVFSVQIKVSLCKSRDWVRIYGDFFTFMWPCIVTNFFIIKPTRCTNFTNLSLRETLHVSDSSSVHHQEFIYCTLKMVYVTQVCRQLSSRNICSCSKAVYKHVWHTPLLNVQWINSWWWTDELSQTCRVSRQNKFVKLVHLFGFVIKVIGDFYNFL